MNEISKRDAPELNIALIKRTFAPNAPDDQLAMFIHDCNRRGVHPLDKLIVFTNAGGKYTPITTIDFMRSRAAESGEMAGSDDALFVSGEQSKPHSATVTVYRLTNGARYAYAATARLKEYYRNTPTWNHMPHTMLAKCAEALALRKAFPHQLGGLYTREETQQAGADDEIEGDVITDETTALFNQLDKQLADAAEEGIGKLQEVWGGFLPREQRWRETPKNERHNPRAIEVARAGGGEDASTAADESAARTSPAADRSPAAATHSKEQ